jgi:hydroxymethylbilane synthase
LALWQAEYVKRRLLEETACSDVTLVAMTTEGDRLLGSSLAKLGGKGLFLKELVQSRHGFASGTRRRHSRLGVLK